MQYDCDAQYRELVKRILTEGEERQDRTGTGTISVFGGHMKFDLRERFPLVQCKETRYKVAFLEMLWFLRGEGTTHYLNRNDCKLWDAWADDVGDLGQVYGVQWRNWKYWYEVEGYNGDYYTWDGVDQVREVIQNILNNPHGRRHIVSAWNVGELDEMALPPCHWAHQLYATNDGYLDMQVNQRSWDIGLGCPFNIAQYALLLHLYSRATHRKPRYLNFSYGDAHLYNDHVKQMKEVVERPVWYDAAKLVVKTNNTDIDGYKPEDFEIDLYDHHPFVKLEVSV
jgi:thymidylate synthase